MKALTQQQGSKGILIAYGFAALMTAAFIIPAIIQLACSALGAILSLG